MKKLKILSLILVGCLLIAGCGISKNIKLTKIDCSASLFFHTAMSGLEFVLNEGQSVVNETLANSYGDIVDSSNYLDNYYYSVVSAVDFCDSIASGQIVTAQTQKIYEYDLDGDDEKIIVFVENKDTTKNNKYIAKLYYVYETVVSYESLLQEQPLLTRTYIFTAQKDAGYSFKEDSSNGITGTYLFDKEKGAMNLAFTYIEQNLIATTTYNTSASLYNYEGNSLGGRIYFSATAGGKTSSIINEFLLKDFYKKAKIGFVKDSKLYINMEETEEEFIAVHNDGDQYVFDVVYDNTIDSKPAVVSAIGWGKQN